MAMQIDYSKLSYSEPAVVHGYEQNVVLLTWALQHTTIDGNWLNLKILQRSDAELLALTTALPAIGNLTQDFQSARDIFFHLAHRFTEHQVTEIDALLCYANIGQMSRSYDPTAAQESSLYLLFCHWASLGYLLFKFFMMSTADAVDISKSFPPMKTSIDGLPLC
jgi:hypothetical protein